MNTTPAPETYADLAEVVLRAAREIGFSSYTHPEALTLTATGSYAMRWIDQHPGASPSEVAEGTGLQRSNLSTALRELERHGLVERRVDTADRRSAHLFPTARAARNLQVVRQEWAARLQDALGPAVDVAAAVTLLDRLAEGLLAARRAEHAT